MKILLLLLISSSFSFSQNYTSYFLGNPFNVTTTPKGGVCLMGGATEHDEAMKWFLQQADGGDVLVLRTSGADGYNDYMLNQLGVSINSVESIVCNDPSASDEAYIHQKIEKAEAIWFAGGDQWNYISYWRNTPVDSLINIAIAERRIVIGGTSAGMAIQGKYYFSAENGTVSSATALANPYSTQVTVSDEPFIENEFLQNVITDTHYDNPDRKGRHVVFLSRILQDYQSTGKGIACDEYTSVCIDTLGFCKIYGDYPSYDEDVYFIQPNCELPDYNPETCTDGSPLTWNRFGMALKVYHAKGTQTGSQTFDLTDWTTGSGGVWEHWYVVNGVLTQASGTMPDCGAAGVADFENENPLIFENPVTGNEVTLIGLNDQLIQLTDLNGKTHLLRMTGDKLDLAAFESGMYFIEVKGENLRSKLMIIH